MFESDRPIESCSEDKLNRSTFVEKVANALGSLKTNDSVVVGLSGDWGSGKTSLINMICESISGDGGAPADECIIVRFNPWNVIEPDNIVRQLFQSLYEGLKNWGVSAGKSEVVHEVLGLMDEYTNALNSGHIKAISRVSYGVLSRKNRKTRNSILLLKEKISERLEKFKVTTIVVIDDIDRLRSDQICSIFQLVAVVADFPSVNYLLAYDEKIVSRALSKIQDVDGEGYLEKIVQVPLRIPQVSPAAVSRMLEQSMRLVLGYAESSDSAQAGASQRLSAYFGVMKQRVRTVRDYKRFNNVLQFELNRSGRSCDPVDLTAMVFLQVFYPKAWSWIYMNRKSLCVTAPVDVEVQAISHERFRECFDSFPYEGEEVNSAKNVVFKLLNDPRSNDYESTTRAILQMNKRIADIDILESYYAGQLDNFESPLLNARDIVQAKNGSGVERIIKTSIIDGKYEEALESLSALSKANLQLSYEGIISALANNIQNVEHGNEYFSSNTRTIDLIENLVENMELRTKDEYVVKLFGTLSCESVVGMAEFVIRRERAYNRNGFSGGRYQKIISVESLSVVEGIFGEAIVKLLETTAPTLWLDMVPALILWKNIGGSAFNDVVGSLPNRPSLVIALAQIFASDWVDLGSGSVTKWSVSEEAETYITREALDSIEAWIASDKTFWDCDVSIRLRVAALACGLKNGKKQGLPYDVELEEAQEQLSEWGSLSEGDVG